MFRFLPLFLVGLSALVSALSSHEPTSRRNLLRRGTAAATAAVLATQPALAVEEEEDVYFGVGCFWHIQHVRFLAVNAFSHRFKSTPTLSCETVF